MSEPSAEKGQPSFMKCDFMQYAEIEFSVRDLVLYLKEYFLDHSKFMRVLNLNDGL